MSRRDERIKATLTKRPLTDEEKKANQRNIILIYELMQNLDCVFCVDTTGSMDDYIVAAKETIAGLIKNIMNEGSVKSVKFGFVAYRDHHVKKKEEYVTLVKPLTD